MTAIRDSYAYPPRGMSRSEAARYIGVGTTKFDELVADGRMPKAKRIDGRAVWDRFALDQAFTDLPDDLERRSTGMGKRFADMVREKRKAKLPLV